MSVARHRRQYERLDRYAKACYDIGGTPGRRLIRRFVMAAWWRFGRRP